LVSYPESSAEVQKMWQLVQAGKFCAARMCYMTEVAKCRITPLAKSTLLPAASQYATNNITASQ
jgi:hypothetical protein